MSKIVVTGGAGFIGGNFVHYWVKNHPDDQITVIDKLTYAGNESTLAPVRGKIEFIKADICDANACKAAITVADYVIHFAAESHNTRSETDPDIFWKTNVEGTRILLDLATTNSKLQRFVHFSTDEVYGDIPEGVDYTEDDKKPGDVQATSDYSKSKAIADDLAVEYMNKLPLNILRVTNNFGPYQYPEKLLPRSLTRILSNQPMVLWGEGNEIRDWLYAPDTARAVELVLQKAPEGEIYNIAANHQPEIRNRDLLHWVMGRLHEHDATIQHIPNPRPHHDFRYGLDDSKARRSLGWVPSASPWQQFEDTVQWYIANQAWWQPLTEEAERIYA